ncbi:hypothetical protein [Pseudarthrobacter sulfonivorans]|uniref:hypothetical protein n=1 Tax=Pseudarthrobacter sulfonivorans TaxID=121292 RepID=UPI00285DAEE2|nr:hypothetical protein [Pseudarthrobacter sulfonivorans]MDR6416901.1 hypothetical protein [Pseudarthrobacter sulfonivorans]
MTTSLRVVEHSPGFLLIQVVSPAGAPPPNGGTVVMQLDDEDGRHDVIAAPVEANGLVQLHYDPVAGRGVLHYSGSKGYAAAAGVEIDLQR